MTKFLILFVFAFLLPGCGASPEDVADYRAAVAARDAAMRGLESAVARNGVALDRLKRILSEPTTVGSTTVFTVTTAAPDGMTWDAPVDPAAPSPWTTRVFYGGAYSYSGVLSISPGGPAGTLISGAFPDVRADRDRYDVLYEGSKIHLKPRALPRIIVDVGPVSLSMWTTGVAPAARSGRAKR